MSLSHLTSGWIDTLERKRMLREMFRWPLYSEYQQDILNTQSEDMVFIHVTQLISAIKLNYLNKQYSPT
jgi:hypothetical protein